MKTKQILILSSLLFPIQTYATITTGLDCDGKCTWTYDSETQSLTVAPNKDETGDLTIQTLYGRDGGKAGALSYGTGHFFWNNPVKSMTIAEGITAMADSTIWQGDSRNQLGTPADSILKLPSTLKNITTSISNNNQFKIIDCSDVKDANITIASPSTQKIIIDENSHSIVNVKGSTYGSYPSNVTIQCKGTDLTVCRNQVTATTKTTLTTDYFKGYDDGKYVEWCETGKKVYDLPNGDYHFYDKDGKYVGNFLPDGSKRRIYAIDEAVAVTEKSGKNTFSIRYR